MSVWRINKGNKVNIPSTKYIQTDQGSRDTQGDAQYDAMSLTLINHLPCGWVLAKQCASVHSMAELGRNSFCEQPLCPTDLHRPAYQALGGVAEAGLQACDSAGQPGSQTVDVEDKGEDGLELHAQDVGDLVAAEVDAG